MNDWLSIINFSFLTILSLLFITSLASEIFYIVNKNKDFIFYLLIIDSILSGIMIIIILLVGFISIYFSSKDKILIYIIVLFISLCLKSISLFLLFNKIDNIKDILFIIIILIFQIVIMVMNILTSMFQRNELIKELEESPLNYVDETITEDMYHSILSQCLNPDDKNLKKDFKKKLKKRKKEILKLVSSTSSDNK